MKKCARCGAFKSLESFGAHKRKPDGLRAECKECTVELNRRNYQKHAEARRADARVRMAEWRAIPGNAERNLEAAKKWYALEKNANSAKLRARVWSSQHPERRRDVASKWRDANRGRTTFYVKTYKQKKRRSAPTWRIDFLIAEAYHLACLRTKLTGCKWHVDHVIPLQGKTVSGLHVESNLAVILARENSVKGNRRWPDMP